MPTVFLSYSHDSEEHRERVKSLAIKLRLRGVTVIIDTDAPDPDDGFIRWMEENVESAGRILIICTETYHRRYRAKEIPGCGRGVAWEAHLIRALLYETVPENHRIRAVTVSDGDEKHVPLVLRTYRGYRAHDKEDFEALCEWLLCSKHAVENSRTVTTYASINADVSPFQIAAMLPANHPTYVARECDRRLAEQLDNPAAVCISISGDYEVGKSSLMMRASSILGSDWIVVGGGLSDLRSDREEHCVNRFFELFQPHFGILDSWEKLAECCAQRHVILRLDDLGQLLAPGARALLPQIMQIAIAARGHLRVITTQPMGIDKLLSERGIMNKKYHRPWCSVFVDSFTALQAKRLISILPERPRAAACRLFAEVEKHSGFRPRAIQCLADRLWNANYEGGSIEYFDAIIRNTESYD